jgi:hypothetical protein
MAETSVSKTINWNSRLEEYLSETGERANAYSWCHKQAEAMYSKRTVFIDIPVIILSTITGSLSVGSQSLFGESPSAPVAIGAVVLFTSILATISSYFSWARRSEAHKQASLSWAKFYRFLSVELTLPRHERLTPQDLLKFTRTEMDTLMEKSPLIPRPIINVFKERFKDIKDTVAFPTECNGLHNIVVYSAKTATPQDEVVPAGMARAESAFPTEAVGLSITPA